MLLVVRIVISVTCLMLATRPADVARRSHRFSAKDLWGYVNQAKRARSKSAVKGTTVANRRVAEGMPWRSSRSILLSSLALFVTGCDPANTDVYFKNNTDKAIYVSFPLDETGSHVRVGPHESVLALKHNFEGPHRAKIEDAVSHKTLDEVDYSGLGVWKGSTVSISYPIAPQKRG
jgi:hypothetical protein